MAKNINHLQHVKSSVVENGLPKLPAPNVLVEGELAVNYATDKETISLKNSSGIVVTFSSDNYYSEKKLGSGFTGENSAVTVTQAINDNERVVAAALTDLDERKLDASAYTQQDLSEYATKQWVDEERLGSGFTGENSGVTVTQAMNNTEKVVAAALNDLDGRKLDASAYTPTDLSDYATKQWVDEERLGSGFTGENSGRTVTQVIEDDELAISAALNDLNGRKLDMSAYTPTDLSNYYDKDEINEFLDDVDSRITNRVSSVTINNSTKVSSNGNVNLGTVVSSMTVNGSAVTVTNGAAALTGLATTSELLKYADKAEYNSSDKKIYFKNGNTTLTSMTIDATDFIKDGMVNEVKIGEPTSGESSGVTCLIVTFNTDAGKEDIEIPLSEIFDSSLYYTKPEIDNVLGSGFTVSAVTSSVTDVFRENELIVAAALNDLDSKKLDASAYTPTDLSGYYTRQEVNTMLGNDFIDSSGESFSSVTDIIRADETVTAAALNDLNERKLDASAYTPSEFTDLLDEKLGYWFSGDSLSSVTDVIRENEIIVSSALNDLESRKLDASAYTPTDLSGYYTKQEIDEDKLGSGFTGDNSGTTVTDAFNTVERVVAAALTDLDDRKLDASAFTESVGDFYTKEKVDDKLGKWFSGDTPISSVTEVIREDELAISAALNDLDGRKLDASAYTPTDLSGYYTKQEIDEDKLGSGFTGENSGKTVTQAINETEIVVAAALTDLDDRKLDASAYTQPDLSAYATKEWIEDDVLGSGFTTGDYSGKSITEVIEENELIIASALNDLDERILEISGSTPSGGSSVMLPIGGNFDYSDPGNSTLDFSNYTFDELSGMAANNQDIALIDEDGYVYRLSNIEYGPFGMALIFVGDNLHRTDGNFYVMFPAITVFNNGGLVYGCMLLEPQTSGGGGGTGDLSGVTFNGVAATKSNGVAAITANVVSSVTMNSANKPINNGALDLGTVITAETQLSTATTGTGVVVTGLTVSNHKITTKMGNITLDNVADGSTRKLPTALSALTADATHRLVTDTEKTSWNGKQDALSNASVLTGITSQKVTNWDNAYTSAHSHSNKSVLDGITTAKVSDWDGAATSAHSHSNKSVLDNLTQTVIDNNHKHSNKTVLDDITTAKTAQWDNAISAVSFNGTDATVTNHKAAITATIPTSLSQLTSAHTHAISEVTNLQTTLNAKVSGITINNSGKVTPTNGVANLTINASTVGALPTGTTLDNVADGTTRKLSNYSLTSHTHDEYATTGTVNTLNNTVTAHTANTEIHVTAANKTSWDNAVTSAHSHSNKTVLDNLTQGVINNSHTHSNKTALDGITTAKTASWDTVTAKTDNSSFTAHTADTTVHVTTANKTQWNNAISGVSFNGATATVSNHVAAITATIPAAPGTLTTTATTAQSTATNEALSGNIVLHKVSKTGSYNDLNDKPTIPAAANNATITLQFGNSSSAFTVNASSNLTINLATLIGIPAPTASDNGKILGVVNGAFAWITPTTIYTGSGTPSSSQGNNGDIYLQTS